MTDQNLLQRMQDIAGKENVLTNEPMKNHTTFKTGGPADYFVMPQTTEQLGGLVKLAKSRDIPYYIMGKGSNLLVSDDGFRGVVVQLCDKFAGCELLESVQKSGDVCHKISYSEKSGNEPEESEISENKAYGIQYLCVKAGLSLIKLGKIAADRGLTGFEFASGIPGTVGGAVVMNAGAYGGEMKDVLVSATIMDNHENIRTLSVKELDLGYRTSIIAKKGWIVLEAVIVLKNGDRDEIQKRISELAAKRIEKQPLEYPSAGSTFKRPEGYFAGKLIEDAGLKGAFVGGAKVSDKHAGFVINTGEATSKDIVDLTDMIVKKVYEMYGVKLELEVKKLGF